LVPVTRFQAVAQTGDRRGLIALGRERLAQLKRIFERHDLSHGDIILRFSQSMVLLGDGEEFDI
jgi:hypothetical protein